MKIEVSRTSFFVSHAKPCDEAFPMEAQDETRYHTGWRIEICSLDELMAFIRKYGQIVMSEKEIEIYDTYRE